MITECKKLRFDLLKALEIEMVGPGSETRYEDEKEEIISESPIQRYSAGILYPQKQKLDIAQETDDTGQNNTSADAERDEILDNAINISNQYYPSALGMSFYTSGLCPKINLKVSAAKYRRLKPNECCAKVEYIPEDIVNSSLFSKILSFDNNILCLKEKMDKGVRDAIIRSFEHDGFKAAVYRIYNLQNDGWKRVPVLKDDLVISSHDTTKITKWKERVDDGLEAYAVIRPDSANNNTLFTVTLINTNESKREKSVDDAYFQVEFSVYLSDQNVEFLDYNPHKALSDDKEELSLALLYRNQKTYATGHGCAVSWYAVDSNKINELRTKTIPFVEVPQLKFDIDELSDELKAVLSMKNLSDISDLADSEVFRLLNEFSNCYGTWIAKIKGRIKGLRPEFHEIAHEHIKSCEDVQFRIKAGIQELKNNENVFTAFKLANKAMFMQRIHSDIQKNVRFPDEDAVIWPDYTKLPAESETWRPFQLAFLLLNICGISDIGNPDRDSVDLIWFPTGGGKTEAYLGVSAFTIFYRRLSKKEKGMGTAIIMRYTLRLLTAQQFQRASTLICACEFIRRLIPDKLGDEPISIGLWIGSDSTPNEINEALSILDKLVAGTENKNPFQLLTCPWCGAKLVKEKHGNINKGSWGYKKGSRPKRFIVHCTDHACEFKDELPVKIIDEDIYNTSPTLLFGTVDKFAMMPWKKEISNIFALDDDNKNMSPELIIQDELHLISGPLGTIVGIYETALDALCSEKCIKPKIIASTATIRRAGDQVRALYNRNVNQFPPPGIDSEDSFFARQASLMEKAGRLYAGVIATGKTMTTTQIRLMAALLQYIVELDYPDEVKDVYWTLVGYFNTLKEIGKTSTLADDDIKDQVRRIAMRRNIDFRRFYEAEELTSRKKADEIPKILEKLSVRYPEKNAISILLASNMISVGVDVDRLGLMTIINQPKTTSEYIQASSRVGRKFPGLIITLYDGARSRDRSHYERFTSYHQAFYKYVEPTSVTPFSGPARDRALHAVMVTMVRHLIGLRKDNDASKFKKDSDDIKHIMQYIINRVEDIMKDEKAATIRDLNVLADRWEYLIESLSELTYATANKDHLLFPAGKKTDKHWETLQSMRNVDIECNVTVLD